MNGLLGNAMDLVVPPAYAQVKGQEKITAEAHPEFKGLLGKFVRILDEKFPEMNFSIGEIYRSPEKQAGLPASATSVGPGFSKHQYGAAADIYPIVDDEIAPYEKYKKTYKSMGEIAESLGLRWGGRWKKPFDPGHFELNVPIGTLRQ